MVITSTVYLPLVPWLQQFFIWHCTYMYFNHVQTFAWLHFSCDLSTRYHKCFMYTSREMNKQSLSYSGVLNINKKYTSWFKFCVFQTCPPRVYTLDLFQWHLLMVRQLLYDLFQWHLLMVRQTLIWFISVALAYGKTNSYMVWKVSFSSIDIRERRRRVASVICTISYLDAFIFVIFLRFNF